MKKLKLNLSVSDLRDVFDYSSECWPDEIYDLGSFVDDAQYIEADSNKEFTEKEFNRFKRCAIRSLKSELTREVKRNAWNG